MSEFITQGTFRPQVQKSLAKAYHLAVNKSNLSFSQCMGNSFRQTVAGLFSYEKMNKDMMLSGHIQATRERVENTEGDYVMAAQDTTYYNYSNPKSVVEDPHPQPLSQSGRGENSVVEDPHPQPLSQSGRGENTDVTNHLGML